MKIPRRDRFRYWWAWNKYDVFYHCVTVAAIGIALVIGGCVFDSPPNVKVLASAAQEPESKEEVGRRLPATACSLSTFSVKGGLK